MSNDNYKRKELFLKTFLIIIIIILILLLFISYINNNNIIKNDEMLIASLEEENNKTINQVLYFEYDDKIYEYPPDKDYYEFESISCDNALGSWDEKEWELYLSNIKGKIKCNILFRKKSKNNFTNVRRLKSKNKVNKKENNAIIVKDNLNQDVVVEENIPFNSNEVISNLNDELPKIEIDKENIINNKYIINCYDDIKYIVGFEPKTKINDVISSFENDNNNLLFYDKNNNLITDYNKLITSGMYIKLKSELDQVFIIIRGDINKDGIVNVMDYKKMNNYFINDLEFDFIEKLASDLDNNGIIDNNDYEKLSSFLSKKIASLN